jgi:hypothetical protein
MLSFKTSQFTPVPIVSLLAGGYLVLTIQYSPAQAQIAKNDFLVAQSAIPLYEVPINQQSLPQLQPMEPVEFYQDKYNNPNYQPSQTTRITQYGQNFERYFVYVNSGNSQTLQRVRTIERSAYIRRYNGQTIIQAGVFTKPSSAQQRVRELARKGINGARIVNFSNAQVVPNSDLTYYPTQPDYYPSESDFNTVNSNVQKQRSNFYYAIIPGSYNNLRYISEQIRQKTGRNTIVYIRNQPRGTHIAVGPFAERSDAEQWNNYLRELGYSNSRVYYGK